MDCAEEDRPANEPPQRARFGPLRTTPPPDVRDALTGAAPGSGWTVDRLGVVTWDVVDGVVA
jgi:hypothetical protein